MNPVMTSQCSATIPMQFRWRRHRKKSSSVQAYSKLARSVRITSRTSPRASRPRSRQNLATPLRPLNPTPATPSSRGAPHSLLVESRTLLFHHRRAFLVGCQLHAEPDLARGRAANTHAIDRLALDAQRRDRVEHEVLPLRLDLRRAARPLVLSPLRQSRDELHVGASAGPLVCHANFVNRFLAHLDRVFEIGYL